MPGMYSIFHSWFCDIAQIPQVQLSLIRDPNITAELIGEVMDWAREYKVLLPLHGPYSRLTNIQGIGKYPEEELHWLTVTASYDYTKHLYSLILTSLYQAWNKAIEFKMFVVLEPYILCTQLKVIQRIR